ncbi:MAG: repeat containing exported protein [Labilithrix sp.]|nr:repeat containing exported protein [Labilithrix sp.]
MRPRSPSVRDLLRAAGLGALVALAAGCGRPESAADKQLADLREQMNRMEAERDREGQRLSALEIAVAEEKSSARSARSDAVPPSPIAPGRVVSLGGGGESESADPNEKNDRPDLRLTGAPGAASRPRAGKTGGRVRIEESEPAGESRSSATDPDAKTAYEAGLALVQAKKYDQGLEALNAFLVRWPDHPYAENAMYWRGEAYFAQGEYLKAGEQLEAVLARFGAGKKAPDALLKLGMCQDRLGSPARAREFYDRLKADYPRSEAAKRIPSAGAGSSTKGPKENR